MHPNGGNAALHQDPRAVAADGDDKVGSQQPFLSCDQMVVSDIASDTRQLVDHGDEWPCHLPRRDFRLADNRCKCVDDDDIGAQDALAELPDERRGAALGSD